MLMALAWWNWLVLLVLLELPWRLLPKTPAVLVLDLLLVLLWLWLLRRWRRFRAAVRLRAELRRLREHPPLPKDEGDVIDVT